MYFNHRGERVSHGRWKEMYQAFQNRQELIKAGLTSRRDLMKLGLLTAAGALAALFVLSSAPAAPLRGGDDRNAPS